MPGKFTFNFVSYELNHKPGGSPASLARLLQKLSKQANNASEGGNNQQFWAALEFDYLHYAIWIAWLAHRQHVTIEHIYDVITSSPTNVDHAQSESFRQSAECWKQLQLADKNVKGEAEDRALFKAGEFYLLKQCAIGDAARGAGIQMCGSVLGSMLIEPLDSTVVAKQSSFVPEMALSDYWCILDAPILKYSTSGQYFQTLVTMMVQEAVLRRSNPQTICAIVRDEAQFLIADIEHESMVQSVCRQSLLANISSVQNLPLLQAAKGGDARSETLVRSLLANYRTKYLLANVCDRTNQMFSEMQGEFKDQFFSVGEGHKDPDDFLGQMLGIKPLQFSIQESLYKRLPPESFLTLRRGGKQFNYLIDAYLMIGGHTFAWNIADKREEVRQKQAS